MRSLPAPDVLEFSLPEGHVIVVVDDGTDLVPALVDRLLTLDWHVVLMRSSSVASTPMDVPVVLFEDSSEAAVAAALNSVLVAHGPIAGCVFAHTTSYPVASAPGIEVGPGTDGFLAGLANKDALRLSFVLAKQLHDSLTEAAGQGWGGFFVVTQLDGALGFTGSLDELPAIAGVTGLTKTLRLEWPAVVSRTIDLAPALSPDAGAEAIVQEMQDPNRLIGEVGWSARGRVTLAVELDGGAEGA